MNEETIADLKQFIAGAITQQTSGILQRLDNLEDTMKALDQKMDDGFAAIAEAFDANGNEFETRLHDHEHRLTRLEAKAVGD